MPLIPARNASTSSRTVWIGGVLFGTYHRQEFRDGALEERTVCGHWPSRTTAVKEGASPCPVCYAT